jgi:hypothetical protein
MNTTKALNKNVPLLQRVSSLRERILQETTPRRDGAGATSLISLYMHCIDHTLKKRLAGNEEEWAKWDKYQEPWEDCP